MRCRNCGKEISDTAKACEYCEAITMTKAEQKESGNRALEVFEQFPTDVQEALHQAALNKSNAEDYSNHILVGECPKCASPNTGDCQDDPEIEDICVGRCYACGHLWCTECRKALTLAALSCPCVDDIEGLDEDGDDGKEDD